MFKEIKKAVLCLRTACYNYVENLKSTYAFENVFSTKNLKIFKLIKDIRKIPNAYITTIMQIKKVDMFSAFVVNMFG